MIIIGIDFSINHPAATIYNTNTEKFNFITIFNDTNGSKKYYLKLKEYSNTISDLHIAYSPKVHNYYDHNIKVKQKDMSYGDRELYKLENYVSLVEQFVFLIKDIVMNSNDVHILMEGFSFGSKGDKLFELGQATGILKSRLITTILKQSPLRLNVQPPMTLKKEFLKGNATKYEIFDKFVDKIMLSGLEHSDFYKNMQKANEIKNNIVLTPKEIKSPWNDIIDSFIAVYFFKNNY